jgi:hypothetical protein
MPRRNAPTAEGVALLLPYVNNITGAIEQGMSRPQIWSEIQAAEAEGGPQIAGATIFDMNYVYTAAKGVLNAQDAFGNLSAQDPIPSEAIAWAPWAVQTTAAQLNPEYQIRYEWQGTTPDGEQVSQWFQTDWSGSLDTTAQTVMDRALTSAQLSLDSYQSAQLAALGLPEGVSITGLGRVQILRF